MGQRATSQSTQTPSLPAEGARVLAVDPRTGVEVFGKVSGRQEKTGVVHIEPVGPGYPPGALITSVEKVEVVAGPDDEVDDYESRKRKEWDITCMVLSGALESLDESGVDLVSNSIAEGHL